MVGSPKHSDVLVVTGPVTEKMKDRARRVYEQTPDPKAVIVVGTCGTSGGVFHNSYILRGSVDKMIPVDVYVPGCPVRPEAIINGVLQAWVKLEKLRGSMKTASVE